MSYLAGEPEVAGEPLGCRRRGLALVAFDGFVQDALGLCLIAPTGTVYFLAWFKILVVHEEVLDLVASELVDIVDVLEVIETNVVENTQQLVIATCFVGHLENADWAGLNDYAREQWLRQDYQSVQWVAVFAESVVDEAIVSWVRHWGEQVAVQVHLAGLMVYLVLVAGALGDLDSYFNALAHRAQSIGTSSSVTVCTPRFAGLNLIWMQRCRVRLLGCGA